MMAQTIPQKPIPPQTDLRDMLRAYLIRRSLICMEAAAERRAKALLTGELEAYRTAIHEAVRRFYRPLPTGKHGFPLKATQVSSFLGSEMEEAIRRFRRWAARTSRAARD